MALFPGALPAAGTASASATLAASGHTSLHNTGADESRAIATKVGTGASTPASGLLLRGNGAGTSAWAQVGLTTDVSGVLPTANGGSGNANLSFPAGAETVVGRAVSETLSNKTLTAPTIADFTNANHDHSATSKGGLLAVNTVGISRLMAIESTDLFNNTAVSATTWTDFKANQNFTVDNANSVILIAISGRAQIGSTSAVTEMSSRIIIDSASSALTYYLGGSSSAAANSFANPFSGAGMIIVTGLAAGVHTIKTQMYTTAANSAAYCRCSSAPNTEFFTTSIVELKR